MYIVGIDIAKRFHEAAIIDSSGKIIVKRIRFANSHTGFLSLLYKNRIETRKSFAKNQADRVLLSISMWCCPLL